MKTVVVMDTRERNGKKDHILSAFEQHGIQVIRHGLYVGDWTLLNDMSVCIDTKTGGMQEVYSNCVTEHIRFRNECKRAQHVGIRLIILVEEDGIASIEDVPRWVNPRAIIYQRKKEAGEDVPIIPPLSSARLCCIMKTMTENYGVEWMFCSKDQTGQRIMELLGIAPDETEPLGIAPDEDAPDENP